MKYWFSLIVILLLFTVIRTPQPTPTAPSSSPPAASPIPSGLVLELDNRKYTAHMQKIDNEAKLILIPNFLNKKLSKTILQENNCRFGTNGGFYTKDAKPLGLFFAGGKYHNKTVHDQSFFNGFVTRTKNGIVDITAEIPVNQNSFDFFFQSGPLMYPQTRLSIKNDEQARRILLTKTDKGTFYFVAFVEVDNSNSGPYLEEIPQLLRQLPISVATAINLDGGAASAFYQENGVVLSELVAVGSFLCEQ